MTRRAWLVAALAPLAGCTSLGRPPPAVALYDLGPPVAQSGARPASRALVLSAIDADPPLDSTRQWYRLDYADARHLRAYSLSRWSAPPAQLVRQRLKARLSRHYVVLDAAPSPPSDPGHGPAPWLLRLALEEFAQRFEAPATSRGRLRLVATLWHMRFQGERLLSRKTFDVAQTASTPDAAGGAQALAAAVDTVSEAVLSWLQSTD